MLKARNKKGLLILLSICMIMNIFANSMPIFAASPTTIAEWNFTAVPSIPAEATGGTLSTDATLTVVPNKTLNYSSTSIAASNWSVDEHWKLQLSTMGYTDLTLSAKFRSSGTGPRDFKVQYSIDDVEWIDINNGSYQITSTSLTKLVSNLSLPEEAWDKVNLYIRFVMTSNISSRAGTGSYSPEETVATGGTSNINNISVAGTAIPGETSLPIITHTPIGFAIANSNASINATITAESTVAAKVYYGTTADGTDFSTYQNMENTSGNDYSCSIPIPAEEELYYYIAATDDSGNRVTHPADITKSHKISVGSPITIAEARTAALGTTVTVNGVVTFIDGSNISIQDNTGGINIFRSGLSLKIGDQIIATGPTSTYGDLLQIQPTSADNVSILSNGNELPIPKVVAIPEINDDIQSQRIKLNAVTLGTISTSGDTVATDSLGNTINIYKIPKLTGIEAGDIVDIIAVVSKFNNVQLRVASSSDVQLADLGSDTEDPVIVHTPITDGNNNVDLELTATITDDRKVTSAKVFYRTIGSTDYKSISMSKGQGNIYSGVIGKAELSGEGLQYYIEASDGTNTTTLPANKTVPFDVTISAEDILGPVIANIIPANGSSTGNNLRPTIGASYSDASGIEPSSVKLLLNGVDVTLDAKIVDNGITYTPSSDLEKKSHYVELRVSDTKGNQTVEAWSFSVGQKNYILDGETGTSSQWVITASSNFTQPIPATGGDFKSESGLSCPNATINFGSGGANVVGWDNGANSKYWIVKTSTKGMADLGLTWRMRSSSSGPRDFKVQYSTDNVTWTDIPDPAIKVNSALALTAAESLFTKSLPSEVSNKDTLYLRWLMTSNVSAGGGTVGSGGTHQINNIDITGAYLVEENQVYAVTTDISGAVPLGTSITFLSKTADTEIKYSTDGGSSYLTAADGQVTLNTLPVTLRVKAVKDNMEDSRVKVFEFTQAKIDTVSTSHQTGAIPTNSIITLTVVPEDATIKYVLTKNVGTSEENSSSELTYTEPIALNEEMFPVKITAKALKENYLDSDPISFTYTAKKATGGEKNYFGQLHSHTTNSDGAGTLEEAFAWARDKAKLDFFAVTDHSNSFDTAPSGDKAGTYNLGAYNKDNAKWKAGKDAAAAAAVPDKFVSFYGFEMTWSGGPGHINTFATEGFVSRNNTELNSKTNDAGMRAYYELLKLHPESISQFNHPGTTFGNFSGFAYYDPIIDQRISLIEVGNGEGAIGSGGYFPSYEQYDMALDKGWHVAPTNNQDNHKAMWGNANTARTVVYTNDFTTEGIYQAMKDMRVYATEDANLDIVYTLNGEQLGTILNTVPDTAIFKVDAKNVAGTNKIKSISIITNGGVEAHKETYGTAEATFDYIMDAPKAGYYYIKVVQEDGRIAVTAPIWLGKAEAVGISEVNTNVPSPVTTEEMTITTTIFNNESTAATLNSVRYQIKGGDIIGDNILNTPVDASTSTKHTQKFTPTEAKRITIIITVNMTVNGTIKTFTREIDLNVQDIEKLNFIGIDASHLNEYVAGNYKDSMGNFSEIAMKYGLRTVMLRTSEEFIAATADPKYQMFVITAPTRRLDPGIGITHKSYSQAELEAIANFAKQGKTIIITGWGDFYESYSYVEKGLENHMAGQQNKLLSAIGATLRLADDEAEDAVNNGGQAPRLYLDDYNGMVSPLLEGILDGQKFSHYGGSTLYAINPDGTPALTLPNSVIPIISGHSTTYSRDTDGDGYGFSDPTIRVPRYGNSPDAGHGVGKVLLTASETLNHSNGITSQVIVSGGAFMSNFEIKNAALDNPADAYSNENILRNLLSTIENITITPIADAKTAEEGTEFTIEGIATVSVYDGTSGNNTGFFDSIYVQDDTGGINLFPVANDVQSGQKIRVTGVVSSYQGETQLAVANISIIDKAITPVTPKTVTTKDAMSGINTGMLIKTTGTVTNIVAEPNGLVNQITIDDGTGPAIVYINAYITPDKNLSFVTEGAVISVIGLGSIGENFTSTTDFLPRIRVRDRGEINLVSVDKYTVKFDSDGGTAVADVTDIAPNTTIIMPKAPTKEGFTFIGWFTGKDGTGIAFTSNTIVNANITVYAKWSKNISGGNDNYDNDDEGKGTKPPVITPSPSTSSVVDSRIEVVFKSSDNGVYKATISAKDVDTIIQQTVDTNTAIEIMAMAPIGAKSVSMTIPASAFKAIAEINGAGVEINTGIASITLDKKALDRINRVGFTGDVEILVSKVGTTILSPEALNMVDTHPVYDFKITNGGKVVTDFDGGKAFVNIPYTLKSGEDVDSVVLFYVNSDGELEYVRSVYNVQTECIEAVLNKFSVYAVVHNKVTFKDVPTTAWYSKAIGFIASRGITSGVGNENFAPLGKLTREQFLVMLMKAYNIGPDSKVSDNFDDVGNNYATAYISAAKRLGISSGIGDNKFGPTKEISRQEMFAMLYNALKVIGELPVPKGNLTIDGYSDLTDVADWALPAMTLMVESGLSSGTGNNKLSPLSISNRADMAQIIYNLLK